MQTKLFHQTRLKLTGWYALVMGLILSLCGLVVYQVLINAYLFSIDRELEAVAGTLHNSIERDLKRANQLEPLVQQLLPDICLTDISCTPRPVVDHDHSTLTDRHIVSDIYQGDYYIRFLNTLGKPVASSGLRPEGLPITAGTNTWQTLSDREGNRYHQVSLPLHTTNNQLWGYLQVGRSLKDVDDRLAALKLTFFLGLPIIVILVGGSSWLLAGLAMQPIDRSYKQMQRFTSDAAHELRSPLAAILATVESILRLPALPEQEARDTLKTIERQVYRLFELSKDLLLLSRLEQRTLTTQLQTLCLNDLVTDLTEEFSALATSANLALSSEVKTHQSVYVLADEDQIYRLASNLITNAIQYTSVGGCIVLTLDCNDHYALLQIRDTGIGIAPENQSRIFDRFYRVNDDRSRQTGGTGLGLAIAQAIVQAHQGSIQVKSEVGKGSTFTIQLPLNQLVLKQNVSN